MDRTAIEWTDATWNPVTGCTKVSPGCKNCYAETFAERWRGVPGHPYEQGFDLKLWPARLALPLRWREARSIFVNSMSDLFHKDVPDAFVDQVFAVMALTPHHTYQVLTKRADRLRSYMTDPGLVRRVCTAAQKARSLTMGDPDKPGNFRRWEKRFGVMTPASKLVAWTHRGGVSADQFEHLEPGRAYPSYIEWPRKNIWIGVSAEDQATWDARTAELERVPAAVRWVSVEPLLESITVRRALMQGRDPGACLSCREGHGFARCPNYGGVSLRHETRAGGVCEDFRRRDFSIHWVVVGGESGTRARPFHIDWARSIVGQCRDAGVPVFVKQLGAHTKSHVNEAVTLIEDPKGGDMAEWPEDLRVREYPLQAVPA